MLPSGQEVVQSLRGSWRLMDEGERAVEDFDVSAPGLLRSFGAIALTAPALVAFLAAERMRHGLANTDGLFTSPEMVAQVLALNVLSFVLIPLLILALFWQVARTARGTGFIVAWNWTEVSITLLLAAPAALMAMGVMDGALATVMTLFFAVIAARLRYAVARTMLGVGAPAALGIMACSFGLEIAASWTLAIGRF